MRKNNLFLFSSIRLCGNILFFIARLPDIHLINDKSTNPLANAYPIRYVVSFRSVA